MRSIACISVLKVGALLSLMGPGCATIVDGTDQKVPVTTIPSGASVAVDGGATAQTPVDLKLSRREEHTLLISHPGYHSERITLTRELSGAIFGNIILGGIVGGVADLASGASHHLEPKQVHVELQKLQAGETITVREWKPLVAKKDAPAKSPGYDG